MGSSKKQTVGYKYYLGMHLILCHGPIDLVKRITVDKRNAWTGASEGGRISISAEGLFGGEEREGGVSGEVDLEMGLGSQGVNDYLLSKLGPDVPAFRRVVGMVLRQCYLGMNPYLKLWGFRGQRVFVRQDGVEQWYPEKAGIPVPDTASATAGHFYVAPNTPQTTGDATGDFVGPMTGTPFEIASAAVVARNTAYINEFGPGAQQVYIDSAFFNGSSVIGVGNTTNNSYPPGTGVVSVATQMVCPGGSIASSPDGQTVVCSIPNDYDMNPAHIIRECLTDPDWGMGYADADMDDDSFVYAADKLYVEGMGISILWDRQTPIEDFINEIVKHISASLFVDRTTGKFVLKLIRDDYEKIDLLVLDELHIQKVEGATRPTAGELVNSVSAVFWDNKTGENGSVTVQDQALIQMQGAVINTTLQYPGFTNQSVTSRVALRALTSLSIPLLSCTVYADRTAALLNIGDVFRMTWPDLGVYDVVMRVTGLALGDGRTNVVKLTVVEDVFAFPDSATVVVPGPPTTGGSDPSDPAQHPELRATFEVPYYEAAQAFGQAQVDSTLASGPDVGYVAAGCGRPGAEQMVVLQTDSGTGFEDAATFDFCPAARLAAPASRRDLVLSIEDGVDLDQVTEGSWASLAGECVRVDLVDRVGNVVKVGRAVLDTVPAEHAAGESLVFLDYDSGADPTEYVAGETIDTRLLTVSGSGRADVATAPVDPVTLAARAIRPYPPGNFKIEGEYFPSWVGTGDVTLTWSHRDRLQQTGGSILDFTSGNVGPEAGVTYTVRVYDEEGSPIWEETGITGTSFTFTADMETGSGAPAPSDTALRDLVLGWMPMAYYRMDDASGNFQDLSGNARHATVVSGTLLRQQPSLAHSTTNYSCYFQTDGYFIANVPVVLGSAHTMGCIMQMTTGASTMVFHKGNYGVGSNQGNIVQIEANGSVKIQWFNSGWYSAQTAVGIVPFGPDPFTFVFVYNGGTSAHVVINGVKTPFPTLGSALPNTTYPFHVGVSNQGSLVLPTDNTYFDEVFVVQSALSDAAIADFDALVRVPVLLGDNGELTFELLAERDGRESWQAHTWTVKRQGYGFNYGEPYGAQAGFGFLYGQTYGV